MDNSSNPHEIAQTCTGSAHDWGLLYAYGLFETIRVYHGSAFLLAEHVNRMIASTSAVDFPAIPTKDQLIASVKAFIDAEGCSDDVIRFTLTYGNPNEGIKPALHLNRRSFKVDNNDRKSGVNLLLTDALRNERSPLVHHKTLNQMEGILYWQAAQRQGCYDSLLFNTQGHLAEGTRTNVFIVRSGHVFTPDRECGLLAGITRQSVIALLAKSGIAVTEARITRAELLSCDECFITNSVIEVLPVKGIAGHALPRPVPGQITQLAARLYADEVRRVIPLAYGVKQGAGS